MDEHEQRWDLEACAARRHCCHRWGQSWCCGEVGRLSLLHSFCPSLLKTKSTSHVGEEKRVPRDT